MMRIEDREKLFENLRVNTGEGRSGHGTEN